MSAFVVSDKHIDALLYWVINSPQYGAPHRVDGLTVYDQPDLVGQDANHMSVNARYDENNNHEYKYHPYCRKLTPVEVIKACDCLEYQSCEFEGWKKSKAHRILNAIREGAIDALPGYDEAEWDQ